MYPAEHHYLTNTLKKKAQSIRSRLARGPSYGHGDKAGRGNELRVRTGSFSDTTSKDNLTKKTVSLEFIGSVVIFVIQIDVHGVP